MRLKQAETQIAAGSTGKAKTDRKWLTLWSPLICLVLLGGLVTERQLATIRLGDPEAYHEKVSQASQKMPVQIGDWVSEDDEVPPAAIKLLRPNLILSRRFTNLTTGQSANFLIVQCRDARDLAGHYPPICYPAHGWTEQGAQPRSWMIGEEKYPGIEYAFSRHNYEGKVEIVVVNFMMLPDGRVVRDMNGIRKAAEDTRKRHYGAASVQLVFDASVGVEQRDQIIQTILSGNHDVLDAIGTAFQNQDSPTTAALAQDATTNQGMAGDHSR